MLRHKCFFVCCGTNTVTCQTSIGFGYALLEQQHPVWLLFRCMQHITSTSTTWRNNKCKDNTVFSLRWERSLPWGVGREPPHRPSTAVLVSKVAPGPILGRRWREGSGGLKGRRRVIHHSASRKVSISLGSKLPLVKCSNYIGTKRCCNAFFSFFFILHCIICMFENNTWLCV